MTVLGLYQNPKKLGKSAKQPLIKWYSFEFSLSPDSALVSQILTTVMLYRAKFSDQNKRSLLKSKVERSFFLHNYICLLSFYPSHLQKLKTTTLNWAPMRKCKFSRANLVELGIKDVASPPLSRLPKPFGSSFSSCFLQFLPRPQVVFVLLNFNIKNLPRSGRGPSWLCSSILLVCVRLNFHIELTSGRGPSWFTLIVCLIKGWSRTHLRDGLSY